MNSRPTNLTTVQYITNNESLMDTVVIINPLVWISELIYYFQEMKFFAV